MAELKVLIEKLEQQAVLYEKMLVVSNGQLELSRKEGVGDDYPDGLLKLIERRQALMGEIDALAARIRTLREELGWPPSGPAAPGVAVPGGQQARQLVERIRGTMAVILRNDEECRRLLEARLQDTGHKLAEARNQKKMYQAYTSGPTSSGAWFFDKKK